MTLRNRPEAMSDYENFTYGLHDDSADDLPTHIKEIVTSQCKLIDPIPPARYLLKTKRKNVDGGDGLRRWTIGQFDPTKRNKTLLLVGGVGAGKTTLTNMMVNFASGVKWEHNVRLQVTDNYQENEKSWTKDTRATAVTAYEIFGWEETVLPFSLTIIDTPGIEDRNGLRPLVEKLRMLLEDEQLDHIDAICHVVKATENRLTEHQKNIFEGFASLLAKDMKDSILTVITHSDGTVPDVLQIIANSKILDDTDLVHFTLNNHLFRKRDAAYDTIYQKTWEDGMKVMGEFFDNLNMMIHKSSKQTIEVLKARLRLEDCGKQSKIHSQVATTCCPVCEENCHVGCLACRPWICEVMLRGKCTVCSKRCSSKGHVREHRRYADNHKTMAAQIDECYQSLWNNALKPDLTPALKAQIKQAKQDGNTEKLQELVDKKKISAEIMQGRRGMARRNFVSGW